MMEERPRLTLIPSPLDKNIDLISKIFLLVMWVLTFYIFFRLPDIIPVHYNAAGKPNTYGNKLTLFVLPVFGTIIYFAFTELVKYPHIFNYIKKITAENALQQYTMATRLLRFLKFAVLFIFSILILLIYFTTTGIIAGLGIWFLPLSVLIVFIPLLFAIRSSLKKK